MNADLEQHRNAVDDLKNSITFLQDRLETNEKKYSQEKTHTKQTEAKFHESVKTLEVMTKQSRSLMESEVAMIKLGNAKMMEQLAEHRSANTSGFGSEALETLQVHTRARSLT